VEKLLHAAGHVAAVNDTLSFTRAAERLNVHQSAVSHRIKQLEAELGYELFERTTRRLKPTAAGREIGRAVDSAIEGLSAAIDRIEAGRRGGTIRLSVPSSLAMKWLIPNLEGARREGVSVSLHAQDEVVDLAAGEADAAIRFGKIPATGLHALKLCNVWLRPVASPAYLRGREDPWSGRFIADRRGEADDTGFSWQAWSTASGRPPPAKEAITYFDRADLMLQAAISGAGIALGRALIVEADVEAGFLDYAGDEAQIDTAYWLVATREVARTHAFQNLSRWLAREVVRTAQ